MKKNDFEGFLILVGLPLLLLYCINYTLEAWGIW